jgi:hypothetical protein
LPERIIKQAAAVRWIGGPVGGDQCERSSGGYMVVCDGGKHRGLVRSIERSQRFGERWANTPLRQRRARLRAEMSGQ